MTSSWAPLPLAAPPDLEGLIQLALFLLVFVVGPLIQAIANSRKQRREREQRTSANAPAAPAVPAAPRRRAEASEAEADDRAWEDLDPWERLLRGKPFDEALPVEEAPADAAGVGTEPATRTPAAASSPHAEPIRAADAPSLESRRTLESALESGGMRSGLPSDEALAAGLHGGGLGGLSAGSFAAGGLPSGGLTGGGLSSGSLTGGGLSSGSFSSGSLSGGGLGGSIGGGLGGDLTRFDERAPLSSLAPAPEASAELPGVAGRGARGPVDWRRAIVLREVLGPPLALREHPLPDADLPG